MPYYTATGAPAAATKGLSSSVRAEFQLVQTAFGMLTPAGGTAISIPYTFSTTTTVADPGAGTLRLNNATQNAATAILADLADSNAADVTNVLGLFDDSTSTVKGFIKLTKLGDSTAWLQFSVSALASPAGYRNITVTNVASSAASPFANGDSILLEFSRNGDKGDAGANGTNGSDGAAGVVSLVRSPRTSNTILGTADNQHLIDATSGTYSQTITAAATLGSGWFAYVGNSGTGFVTLDPNGAETITVRGVAQATWALWPGEMGLLVCDGVGFYYYPIQLGSVQTVIGASVATVSFSTGLAYRGNLQVRVDAVTLDTATVPIIALNSTQPNLTSSVTATVTTLSGANGDTGGGVPGRFANVSLMANASNAVDKFHAALDIAPTATGTHLKSAGQGSQSAGSYNVDFYSMFWSGITTATLSSITLSLFNGAAKYTGGTITLREIW